MPSLEEQHEVLDWNLANHVPNDNGMSKILAFRQKAKEFGHMIIGNAPDGREKSLALTKIEEALSWANASVARVNTEDSK